MTANETKLMVKAEASHQSRHNRLARQRRGHDHKRKGAQRRAPEYIQPDRGDAAPSGCESLVPISGRFVAAPRSVHWVT